jgi:hypothetical protein
VVNLRRFAVLACVALNALSAANASADTVVYPTGEYPTDVRNIQLAIRGGGIVYLRSHASDGTPQSFNFGPASPGGGFVLLNKNVELVGETVDGWMTTIRGGNTPIAVTTSISAVRNLHLQSPYTAGIRVFRSDDCELADNVITNVVPQFSGSFGVTFGWGILSGSGLVGGRLLITRNTVDGVRAWNSYGILVTNATASTRIRENVITNVDLNAVLVSANSGAVSIEGNRIAPGTSLLPDSPGNGILFGHTRGGPAWITNNTIICDNPLADGIAIVGLGTAPLEEHDAVIENNDVTMHGSLFGGISLYDQASDNLVRANKISGYGAAALQISTYLPPGTAERNSFIGNNVSQFQANLADIFLDMNSVGTIVKGNQNGIIDLGSNDSVRGAKGVASSLGARVRSAQALRREIRAVIPDDDGSGGQ